MSEVWSLTLLLPSDQTFILIIRKNKGCIMAPVLCTSHKLNSRPARGCDARAHAKQYANASIAPRTSLSTTRNAQAQFNVEEHCARSGRRGGLGTKLRTESRARCAEAARLSQGLGNEIIHASVLFSCTRLFLRNYACARPWKNGPATYNLTTCLAPPLLCARGVSRQRLYTPLGCFERLQR